MYIVTVFHIILQVILCMAIHYSRIAYIIVWAALFFLLLLLLTEVSMREASLGA